MLRDVHQPKVRSWLKSLEKHEPNLRYGELLVKNLEEDPNVPDSRKNAFVDHIKRNHLGTTAQDAFDSLQNAAKAITPFDHAENEPNRIDKLPFLIAGRIVSLADFMYFNSLNGERLTRKPEKEDKLCEIVAAELQANDFDISRLQNHLGPERVFATNGEALFDKAQELMSPDALRDSLGLDYAMFDPGHRLVCFFYDPIFFPEACACKPTVLEAPTHHPFLPSEKASSVGRTQHLETGAPCLAEVIHGPVRAADALRVFATEKIESKGSQGQIVFS
jgi:hypothetical protein